MSRMFNVLYNTPLTRQAKTIIDLAKKENGQRAYQQESDYDALKEIYLEKKVDFLSKGDYDFSYKTCSDVTDVTESSDKLNWNYVYLLKNTEPIMGVRDVMFANGTQQETPYIDDRTALSQGQVVFRGQTRYVKEELRFYFNMPLDLLYTNQKPDLNDITIKFLVNDEDLPPEVVSAFKFYMARIISSNDIHRRDFMNAMDREYQESVTACEIYREDRKNRATLTPRDEWLNDIAKSMEY